MNDMVSAFAAVASATAHVGDAGARTSAADSFNRQIQGAPPGIESVADTFLLLPQAITAGSFQRQLHDQFPPQDLSRPAGSSLPPESPSVDESGAPRPLFSQTRTASLGSASTLALISQQEGGGTNEPRASQPSLGPVRVDIAR